MFSKEEIKNILASKGFTAVDLSVYKNQDTMLQIVCEHGHQIEASLRTVRNNNFKCPICEGQKSVAEKVGIFVPPKKQGFRIIGFDNATENAGVSVFDDGKLVFYHLYHFDGETITRLVKNRELVEDVILQQWQPDLVVVEDIQYQQNIITFKTLAMLLGSTLVSLKKQGVRFETVLSKVWRSHFLISGKTRIAEKQCAISTIKTMYGIDVTDDVAEAILIGKYGVDCLRKSEIKKLF